MTDTTPEAQGNHYDVVNFTPQAESMGMVDNVCYSGGLEYNTTYNRLGTWNKDLKLGSGRLPQPSKKPLIIIAGVTIALVLYAVICSIALAYAFWEISSLKSEATSMQEEVKVKYNYYTCSLVPFKPCNNLPS